MSSTSTTSLKLEAALKNRIRILAQSQRRSPHWVMREAIAQYVEREEKRHAFTNEAMESWRRYRETGRHLTNAEVGGWLDQWGTPEEAPIPECHE